VEWRHSNLSYLGLQSPHHLHIVGQHGVGLLCQVGNW